MALKTAGLGTYTLAGSISSTATSITLSSFKVPITNTDVTMTTMGTSIAYGTISPGTVNSEFISFTGITQNANGTATLTGVTRGLDKQSPYTTSSSFKRPHSGQAQFILSDSPNLWDSLAIKQNDETISGQYTFTAQPISTAGLPTGSTDLATKQYVDNTATGTTSINRITVAGTAGETITKDQVIYLKASDGRWWLADADVASTDENVILGIAQGDGTAGNAISSGVLTQGLATLTAITLTANTKYYVSNTAGGFSSTPGTTEVTLGISQTTTTFLLYPRYDQQLTEDQQDALAGTSSTISPSATNKYIVNSTIPAGIIMPYAGSSAPTDWLLCDGTAVSRSTYATLFAVISTTYGTGDGSTTFNVPDFRGRTAIGAGTGTKVATFASRSSDTITVTGLSNIANNEFQTGQAVTYSTSGSVITGLTNNTTYYVVKITNTSFKLATSLANAQAGTIITLSSDGTGTQTFTLTLSAITLGNTGGEQNHLITQTQMPAHTHTIPSGGSGSAGTTSNTTTNAAVATNPSTSSAGGTEAINNYSPFTAVNYIIKTI